MNAQREAEVSVTAGGGLVQRCPCSGVTMADGSPGVLWRGQAYPLLPGNRIDVNPGSAPQSALVHAVLQGDDANWILIQGLPAAFDAARRVAEQAGIVVWRAGRWRAFRPHVVLLRDRLTVAVGEFQSRCGFCRAIQELPVAGGRPEGWKKVHSAARWWERHVTTGRDNTGRAYARFDPSERLWSLLLGWKAEQDRDLSRLRRQP